MLSIGMEIITSQNGTERQWYRETTCLCQKVARPIYGDMFNCIWSGTYA